MKLIKTELEKRFEYRADTGVLLWKSGRCKGKEAGWIDNQGYRKVRLNGTNVSAHRIIWVLMTGECIDGKTVDHKDRNRSNNCWDNLRLATREEQQFNKMSRGFQKMGNRFKARIRVKGKDIHLGMFATEQEAHEAYKKKCAELRGEFVPC